MAVYMFTLHGYLTWLPDNPRGYVQNGQTLPPDPDAADRYRNNATDDPVVFDRHTQSLLLAGSYDITQRRDWRLFAFAAEPTHAHIVIGWRGFIPSADVRDKLTNLLSKFLGDYTGHRGKRWFVRKPSRRRVRDTGHLSHLTNTYLPRHSGVFWKRGDDPPPPLQSLVDAARRRR